MSMEDYHRELMNEWNRKYETKGQKVLVREKDKTEYEDMTCSAAFMHDGIAYVYLEHNQDVEVRHLRGMRPCTYCLHSVAEPFPFETDKGEAVCDDCGQEKNMH